MSSWHSTQFAESPIHVQTPAAEFPAGIGGFPAQQATRKDRQGNAALRNRQPQPTIPSPVGKGLEGNGYYVGKFLPAHEPRLAVSSIEEVAEFIIRAALRRDQAMSTAKLEALLFFTKGWGLAAHRAPMFPDMPVVTADGINFPYFAAWLGKQGNVAALYGRATSNQATSRVPRDDQLLIERITEKYGRFEEAYLQAVARALAIQVRTAAGEQLENDQVKWAFINAARQRHAPARSGVRAV